MFEKGVSGGQSPVLFGNSKGDKDRRKTKIEQTSLREEFPLALVIIIQKARMQQSFQKGEVVWAKISGYPWWPAAVAEIGLSHNQNTCLIKFLGEDSHSSSTLCLSKIAKYIENRGTFGRKAESSKRLREAVEIAERIIQGCQPVEKEFLKLKVTLNEIVVEKYLPKTAIDIEDHNAKEIFEVESTELSCCHSTDPSSRDSAAEGPKVGALKKERISQEEAILQELEKAGIDEENVMEILESRVLKRLVLSQRERTQKLEGMAKKALLRKYFSKSVSVRAQPNEQKQKPQTLKVKRRKLINKPTVKLAIKPAIKPLKEPKHKLPSAILDLQLVCIRKLFQIARSFNLDSQSSRQLSSNAILHLKTKHCLQSREFQTQFLRLVEWMKHHRGSPTFVTNCYTTYLEGASEEQVSKLTECTQVSGSE